MARLRIGLPTAVLPTARKRRDAKSGRKKTRRWRGWKLYALIAISVPILFLSIVTVYYYVTFSRMIDARLHGELQRTDPRIFARPFTVRRGQRLTEAQMIDRLNDLGYAQRTRAEQPGEFTIGRDTILVVPRDGAAKGRLTRIHFVARG
jgi:hypothetical protein